MERLRSAYDGWINLSQPKKMKILRVISVVSFFLFSFVLVVYIFSETRQVSRSTPKTVIFMDAMPHNLEVIRYYAQRRDIEVSMIVLSLSGWVGNLNAAYENVAAFLKLLYNEGYSQRIPLFYGGSLAEADWDFLKYFNPSSSSSQTSSPTACSSRRRMPDSLMVNAELMFGAASYLRQVDVGDSAMRPSFFAEPLRAFLSGNSADFLVLGPCTDASWFLQNHAAHRARVSSIVVAGGAFLGAGDAPQVIQQGEGVEMSFFLDPLAADFLVGGAHGRPVTLVPLEAALPWRPAAYDAIIADRVGDPAGGSAGLLAKALYGYHSLLTAAAARVSPAVIAAAYKADVYLQDGARGAFIPVRVLPANATSIGGRSIRPRSGGFDVKVVLELDADRFFDHLVNVNALPLV